MSQTLLGNAQGGQDDEIDLSALLYEIWGNKWLILAITVLSVSIGAFYASRQVPQYRSDVLLQIESNQSGLGSNSPTQILFRSGASEATQAEIALMQSRFILEPVIDNLGLDIRTTYQKKSLLNRLFPGEKKTITVEKFEVPRRLINQPLVLMVKAPNQIQLFNREKKLILEGSLGQLLESPDQRIQLKVNDVHAPAGSQFSLVKRSKLDVVKHLSQQLRIEESGSKSRQATGLLELSLVGSDPKQVVRTLNAIASTAQAKDAKKKSQEAAQTLSFLYRQLPITKGALEKAELALNQYRAKSGKIDIKLQTQFLLNQLSELDKALSSLRISKIDMMQHYTDLHPAVMALETKMKASESQRALLSSQLRKLPASDQIAVNLMREVSVKKSLYLSLLRKIQELEVVKAGTVSGVHILSPASYPLAALPSKNAVIYLASVLLGLMLSVLMILGRKLISPRVTDPHWGEKQFNLPNLAIIPYCKEQATNTQRLKEGSDQDMLLLAHTNPRNLSIESLRSLRTSLQVTLSSAPNNLISILGISPGVGKTFVSVNLAYLLAAGGKRVLVIDGDLRRGTLHKYMRVEPSPGLADVLSGTVDIEQAIVSDVHPQLSVLPRGAYPSAPSELLMSDLFKQTLQSLSKKYDVVIVDTAPVLLVTDAVLIGVLSGTNYLVVGAGAHQPSDIDMVIKRLNSAQVSLHGTIFNFYRAEKLGHAYGQYGKYSKYNRYYYDEALKAD